MIQTLTTLETFAKSFKKNMIQKEKELSRSNFETNEFENMDLFAINEAGKQFPIKAEMDGNFPYLMNVRADTRITIHVKVIKTNEGNVVTGIDAIGRLYDVRAIADSGESFEVVGGVIKGNVIPINVVSKDGSLFPVKAVSSLGDVFDVKGIKVKQDEVEDIISGLNNWVKYYAHIKALAPAQTNK